MVRNTPHIYFAGNMPRFETAEVRGDAGQRVRVVCIPDFATTHTAVLVDLASLECSPICFGGASPDGGGEAAAGAEAGSSAQ